jgi:hypothetical protein
MNWIQYKNTNYFVNELGQIKTTNWKNTGQERIMSLCDKGQGYLGTVFVIDGKNTSVRVHRVIAEVFIPNPDNKPEVNHINGDKSDNRVENLEWVTKQENMDHYREFLNVVTLRGSEIGNSKLTEKEVLEIRNKFIPRVYGRKQLAEEYNVSPATIKDIIMRKSWKHI